MLLFYICFLLNELDIIAHDYIRYSAVVFPGPFLRAGKNTLCVIRSTRVSMAALGLRRFKVHEVRHDDHES